MFGAADVAFEENGCIAESGASFGAGFGEFGFQFGRRVHHAHAAAAATEGGFDDEWKAYVFGQGFNIGAHGRGTGHHRNAGRLCQFASGGLVAQCVEKFGVRPHESDARFLAGARKRGVFGEETIAGMNGVYLLLNGEFDDGIDIKVSLHGPFALADKIGFVGLEAMQAEAVFL